MDGRGAHGLARPGELRLVSVKVCRPFTRLAAQRPFYRKIGPTNPGDRHAMSGPRRESSSTAECATVFGQLMVLSGKSRLYVLYRRSLYGRMKRHARFREIALVT